MISTFNLLVAF